MRKSVLVYGLISGGIMAAVFFITMTFLHDSMSEGVAMAIGYTTMILAFTLVYFGVRSYRENERNGVISFGRAFGVGALIMLVASVIYVISWMIIQHYTMPDFYEKYFAHQQETLKASGASPEKLAEASKEANMMLSFVKNPIGLFFMTLIEPLPVGILATLISAIALRKKDNSINNTAHA